MRTMHPGNRITTLYVALIALLFFFSLVIRPALAEAEITVSATLSSVSFAVDEGAQLTITVNGIRSAELQIPETETGAFEIYQRGRHIRNSWINGQSSSAITFTCSIRAYTPGNYSIPPITIRADNTIRTTEEIPFEVTASSQPGRSSGTAASPPPTATAGGGERTAFLTLVNTQQESYVGEIIPVEIKAYFRQGLRANLSSAPVLIGDGLVMPQLHEQPVQTREMVGGTVYSVLTWQTTLSNIKEGKHTVHLELDATLLIPQRRMSTSLFGQHSPFDDDFFDSVFGGYKQQPIKAVSDDITMLIWPLPEEGRPQDFTGAIGDFSFQVSAAPQQAETGEPLTLTMTVKGTGNFDRVEAPVFPDSADWKTYTPSATFNPQDGSSSAGEKVFEQAIVARNPSIQQIPSLSFSYFDPHKGVYVTRESAPVPVTITSNAAAPPPVASAAPEPQTPQPPVQVEAIAGLAPLHLEAGKPVAAIEPLYRKTRFLALMTLCLVALLILAGLRIYQAQAAARPEDRFRRQLAKALQDSCMDIEHALGEENSAAFLAACRAAIRQHLGTIWQCQPSAITRADLVTRLPDAPELLEIFTVAEQAAYSGCQLRRETMTRYATILKSELEKLI